MPPSPGAGVTCARRRTAARAGSARIRAISHTPGSRPAHRIAGLRQRVVPGSRMDLQSLRMMVVEDQAVPRQVAVAILRCMGVAEIFQAEDGQDALEQIRGSVGALDVIICDLDMPRMDGVEFIRD